MPNLSIFDKLISEIDVALRTLLPPKQRTPQRQSPSEDLDEPQLNRVEQRQIAGLMRVNHAGEVCAQALYQGQALTAHLTTIKAQMQQAAEEEIDHLAWCEQRLNELNSQPSLLNPLWYLGSFVLGSLAGLAGDRLSLGFVAETEQQVATHLQAHLNKLPAQDEKSKAILEQMYQDEAQHADIAREAGGIELPFLIKKLMQGMSKIMTHSSYYI